MKAKQSWLVCVCILAGITFASCDSSSLPDNPTTPTFWLQPTPKLSLSTHTPTYESTTTAEASSIATATVTATPLPTPTPTISPPIGEFSGGAILGVRDQEAILYGLREGTEEEQIYIYDTIDFSEVESQQLIISALNGDAFAMVVHNDQQFSDGQGNETLVDFIAGWPMDAVVSNQDVAVAVGRTTSINTSFPVVPFDPARIPFLEPATQPVKIEGWLELYAIQQIDVNLTAEGEGSFNMVLLHDGEKIYVLGFLPGYGYKVSPHDEVETEITLNMGPDFLYLAWGFPGKSVSLWLQDKGTIFQTAYIEAFSVIETLANEQIIFITDRDGYDSIYTVKGDGSQLTRVFAGTDITPAGPVWSPDHTKIAFFSTNEDKSLYNIFIVNSDGSGLTKITADSTFNASPNWSPDGQKLIYTCGEAEGDNREVCFMNVDGSGKTILTNSPSNDGEAHWSPDGSQIIFYSKRDGNLEVYTMKSDGSAQLRLTHNDASDWPGCWSPDGSQILFNTNRDGNYEIYIMNSEGTNPINLTNNPAGDWAGYYSADGRYIIFESDRDGHSQLYVMNADGSGQRRLLQTNSNDLYPDW